MWLFRRGVRTDYHHLGTQIGIDEGHFFKERLLVRDECA